MTDPLERRLRETLRHRAEDVDATADGWSAIRARTQHAQRTRWWARRGPRLATACALAAAAALAVPLAVDRFETDAAITFVPPPPGGAEIATAAPGPLPSTAPTEDGGRPTAPSTPPADPAQPALPPWTAADDGGALTPGPNVSVEDATSLGSRVVAVGSFTPTPGARQAGVWLADGATGWRLVDDPGTFGGEPDTYTTALGVAGTRVGLVAVGQTYGGVAPDTALVWTSVDGTAWERTELPGEGRAIAVAEVAGGGLVVTGQTPGHDPAVWTSADGVTWDVTVLETLGLEGTLDHVVAIGDRVVALGRSSLAMSEDGGASWSQVPRAEAGLAEGTVEDLAVLGDGSLATVIVTEAGLVGHVSADGATWLPGEAFPAAPDETMQRVTSLLALPDATLVAGGLAFNAPAATTVAALWSSGDGGRSWSRDAGATAELGGGTLQALAATDKLLVALGNGPGGAEAGGRAWTRPLP